MKRTNNEFKVKSLLTSMYETLKDNGKLTEDMETEYSEIMRNYHDSILKELNQSLMSNSEKVRRYEAL